MMMMMTIIIIMIVMITMMIMMITRMIIMNRSISYAPEHMPCSYLSAMTKTHHNSQVRYIISRNNNVLSSDLHKLRVATERTGVVMLFTTSFRQQLGL